MIPYFLIFSYFSAFSFAFGSRRDLPIKLYFLWSFAVLFIFIGYRYASVDYFTYNKIFNYINNYESLGPLLYDPIGGEKPHESLFSLLVLVTKSLGGDFTHFIALFSLVSLIPKFFCFYKMSVYPALALVLYCSMWLSNDLGQMRTGMAGGFSLLAIYFLANASNYKFIVSSYLSTVSHTVGAVSFLSWFFNKFRIRIFSVFVLLGFYAFSFVGGFAGFFISILVDYVGLDSSSRIVRYSLTHRSEGYSPLGGTVLLHLVLSILFLIFYNRLCSVSKYNSLLIFCFVYGFCFMLLFIDYGIVFYRVRDVLLMPVMVVLLPSIVAIFKKEDRIFSHVALIGFAFLLFSIYRPRSEYVNLLFFGNW